MYEPEVVGKSSGGTFWGSVTGRRGVVYIKGNNWSVNIEENT